MGKQNGADTGENSTELLQKIKNGTALWPMDTTSADESQNTNTKKYMHPYVHCSVIYNSQDLEVAQVSISRWVDKTAMEHLPTQRNTTWP